MNEVRPEALKEIWKAKFKKAKDSEFNMNVNAEIEAELLKMKINIALDNDDKESFQNLSKKLKSIEHFLSFKRSQIGGKCYGTR